jgi:ATP-dependent Lon protease, bacterial type
MGPLEDIFRSLNIPAIPRPGREESGGFRPDDPRIPEEIAILPLRGLVVYPMTAVPIRVGQPRSIRLVDDAVVGKRVIGLVAAKDPEIPEPGPDDVYRVGTIAIVHRLFKAPDETITLIMQGLRRIRIEEFIATEPYLIARVREIPEQIEEGIEIEALQRTIVDTFRRLAELLPAVPEELMLMAINAENPLQLAYAIATHIRMNLEDAQRLLELDSTREKLHFLLALVDQRTGGRGTGGAKFRARPSPKWRMPSGSTSCGSN